MWQIDGVWDVTRRECVLELQCFYATPEHGLRGEPPGFTWDRKAGRLRVGGRPFVWDAQGNLVEVERPRPAGRKLEVTRLGEVRLLAKDLESQLANVEALQTSQVRRFRDTLWFELAQLRAEAAYLEAHVASLAAMLGLSAE